MGNTCQIIWYFLCVLSTKQWYFSRRFFTVNETPTRKVTYFTIFSCVCEIWDLCLMVGIIKIITISSRRIFFLIVFYHSYQEIKIWVRKKTPTLGYDTCRNDSNLTEPPRALLCIQVLREKKYKLKIKSKANAFIQPIFVNMQVGKRTKHKSR